MIRGSTISAISKYWDTLTYHFGIFWEEPDSDLDSHSILDKSIPWRCLLDALTSMLGNGSTSNQEMVRLRSQHSHIDAYSCFFEPSWGSIPMYPPFSDTMWFKSKLWKLWCNCRFSGAGRALLRCRAYAAWKARQRRRLIYIIEGLRGKPALSCELEQKQNIKKCADLLNIEPVLVSFAQKADSWHCWVQGMEWDVKWQFQSFLASSKGCFVSQFWQIVPSSIKVLLAESKDDFSWCT